MVIYVRMEFAAKLKTLLKEQRLSQEAVADRLEVSQNTVSRWAKGAAFPDIVEARKLADLFGVSLNYLARDEEESPVEASGLTWQEKAVVEIYRGKVRLEGAEKMTPNEVMFRLSGGKFGFSPDSRESGTP